MITLYDYFRSSAAYRVRTALYLKGAAFKSITVDLLKGENLSDEYKAINPEGVVPYFVTNKVQLSQSIAILEYLDAIYPKPLLVFGSAEDKAYIRQMSSRILADIHALSQPKTWKTYLMGKLGVSEEKAMEWVHHWINAGLEGYEGTLKKQAKAGKFTFGDQVSMADLCLVSQLYGARRFKMDLSAFPKILEIERNCIALEPFQKGAPEAHKDAPEGLEQIHGPNSPLLKQPLSKAV